MAQDQDLELKSRMCPTMRGMALVRAPTLMKAHLLLAMMCQLKTKSPLPQQQPPLPQQPLPRGQQAVGAAPQQHQRRHCASGVLMEPWTAAYSGADGVGTPRPACLLEVGCG